MRFHGIVIAAIAILLALSGCAVRVDYPTETPTPANPSMGVSPSPSSTPTPPATTPSSDTLVPPPPAVPSVPSFRATYRVKRIPENAPTELLSELQVEPTQAILFDNTKADPSENVPFSAGSTHYDSLVPLIPYPSILQLQNGSTSQQPETYEELFITFEDGGEIQLIIWEDGYFPELQPLVEKLRTIQDTLKSGTDTESETPASAAGTNPPIGTTHFYSNGSFKLQSIIKAEGCETVGADYCYVLTYQVENITASPIPIHPWIGMMKGSTGKIPPYYSYACPDTVEEMEVGTLGKGEFKTGNFCVYFTEIPTDPYYDMSIVPAVEGWDQVTSFPYTVEFT